MDLIMITQLINYAVLVNCQRLAWFPLQIGFIPLLAAWGQDYKEKHKLD